MLSWIAYFESRARHQFVARAPSGQVMRVTINRRWGQPEVRLIPQNQIATLAVDENETVEITEAV